MCHLWFGLHGPPNNPSSQSQQSKAYVFVDFLAKLVKKWKMKQLNFKKIDYDENGTCFRSDHSRNNFV